MSKADIHSYTVDARSWPVADLAALAHQCPLLTQSRRSREHSHTSASDPKRTSQLSPAMSAPDPKRTPQLARVSICGWSVSDRCAERGRRHRRCLSGRKPREENMSLKYITIAAALAVTPAAFAQAPATDTECSPVRKLVRPPTARLTRQRRRRRTSRTPLAARPLTAAPERTSRSSISQGQPVPPGARARRKALQRVTAAEARRPPRPRPRQLRRAAASKVQSAVPWTFSRSWKPLLHPGGCRL